MAYLPPGHAAHRCKLIGRERACLRERICPATKREWAIRPCDVCVVGTRRARRLAAHARRVDAMILGA